MIKLVWRRSRVSKVTLGRNKQLWSSTLVEVVELTITMGDIGWKRESGCLETLALMVEGRLQLRRILQLRTERSLRTVMILDIGWRERGLSRRQCLWRTLCQDLSALACPLNNQPSLLHPWFKTSLPSFCINPISSFNQGCGKEFMKVICQYSRLKQ